MYSRTIIVNEIVSFPTQPHWLDSFLFFLLTQYFRKRKFRLTPFLPKNSLNMTTAITTVMVGCWNSKKSHLVRHHLIYRVFVSMLIWGVMLLYTTTWIKCLTPPGKKRRGVMFILIDLSNANVFKGISAIQNHCRVTIYISESGISLGSINIIRHASGCRHMYLMVQFLWASGPL